MENSSIKVKHGLHKRRYPFGLSYIHVSLYFIVSSNHTHRLEGVHSYFITLVIILYVLHFGKLILHIDVIVATMMKKQRSRLKISDNLKLFSGCVAK